MPERDRREGGSIWQIDAIVRELKEMPKKGGGK